RAGDEESAVLFVLRELDPPSRYSLGMRILMGSSICAGAFGKRTRDGRAIAGLAAQGAGFGLRSGRAGVSRPERNDCLDLGAASRGKNFQLATEILDALAHSPQSDAESGDRKSTRLNSSHVAS